MIHYDKFHKYGTKVTKVRTQSADVAKIENENLKQEIAKLNNLIEGCLQIKKLMCSKKVKGVGQQDLQILNILKKPAECQMWYVVSVTFLLFPRLGGI